MNTPADDPVNHPAHYTTHPSGVECIQITEHMGFNLGNAVKYIWRADAKGNALEDLRKAAWYLEREIARREGQICASGQSHAPHTVDGRHCLGIGPVPTGTIVTDAVVARAIEDAKARGVDISPRAADAIIDLAVADARARSKTPPPVCKRPGCGHDESWHPEGLCDATACNCPEFRAVQTPPIRGGAVGQRAHRIAGGEI